MIRHLALVWAVILTATVIPQQVNAQAYQCRMPAHISVPDVRADGAVRRLPVTGYMMALSWSPEFCKTRKGQARHATQCSGRNGRFGFILHGFWPESGTSWPQFCPTARRLSSAEARRNMCMMPSARLQAREWLKHGSCMVRKPETYFRVSRILWRSLSFPDMDRLSREKGLTAGQVREAFLLANPGWRSDAIGFKLNRRGWLQEMRLCYGKDFMPTKCDRRRFGPGNGARVKIWRGL